MQALRGGRVAPVRSSNKWPEVPSQRPGLSLLGALHWGSIEVRGENTLPLLTSVTWSIRRNATALRRKLLLKPRGERKCWGNYCPAPRANVSPFCRGSCCTWGERETREVAGAGVRGTEGLGEGGRESGRGRRVGAQ